MDVPVFSLLSVILPKLIRLLLVSSRRHHGEGTGGHQRAAGICTSATTTTTTERRLANVMIVVVLSGHISDLGLFRFLDKLGGLNVFATCEHLGFHGRAVLLTEDGAEGRERFLDGFAVGWIGDVDGRCPAILTDRGDLVSVDVGRNVHGVDGDGETEGSTDKCSTHDSGIPC